MNAKNKEDIQWLTNCFIEELLEQGFCACVLVAVTGSIYISVDYDLCGKIRISDHWSDRIGEDIKYNISGYRPPNPNCVYYPLKKSRSMVRKIVKSCMRDRQMQYTSLGWGKYKSFMERNSIPIREVTADVLSTLELGGKRAYRKERELRSKSAYFKKYFPKGSRFGNI